MNALIEDEEVGENVLPNLTSLELEILPNLVSLCGDHDLNLQSLKRLTVFKCQRLAVLFTSGMAQHLKILTDMYIKHCEGLKTLIKDEEVGENVLPNLTSLLLRFLPNLTDCGKLKEIGNGGNNKKSGPVSNRTSRSDGTGNNKTSSLRMFGSSIADTMFASSLDACMCGSS
ncbi:hypothetical protein AMTR_s01155p00010600 [Amborella trichopoda]|uniref:Disease resistance protein At4g27190-like leucine-rich repeats domain-containing protein n=1 Tax=Amborella trichopoda TaxID=13333 RepID=W1NRN6_AMBTC|nr:hypothetical protein AMTR_s01155p00010600 [Amborella trichopoda]